MLNCVAVLYKVILTFETLDEVLGVIIHIMVIRALLECDPASVVLQCNLRIYPGSIVAFLGSERHFIILYSTHLH